MKATGVQILINNYPLVTSVPTLVVGDNDSLVITSGKIIIPATMTVNIRYSYDRINFFTAYTGQSNVTIPLSGAQIQQIELTKTAGTGVVTVVYGQGDNPPTSPLPVVPGDGAALPTTSSVSSINQFYNGSTLDLGRSGFTAVQSGATGFQNDLPFIVYNVTDPVATNGQIGPLQGDSAMRLKTRDMFAPKYENNPLSAAQMILLPVSAPDGSWTPFKNLGANATLNVKASGGNIQSLYCRSRSAAIAYLQLFITATVPSGGAVPDFSFMIPIGGSIMIGNDFFGLGGAWGSLGWAFGFSSTENTYTAGTAADHSTWILIK